MRNVKVIDTENPYKQCAKCKDKIGIGYMFKHKEYCGNCYKIVKLEKESKREKRD